MALVLYIKSILKIQRSFIFEWSMVVFMGGVIYSYSYQKEYNRWCEIILVKIFTVIIWKGNFHSFTLSILNLNHCETIDKVFYYIFLFLYYLNTSSIEKDTGTSHHRWQDNGDRWNRLKKRMHHI